MGGGGDKERKEKREGEEGTRGQGRGEKGRVGRREEGREEEKKGVVFTAIEPSFVQISPLHSEGLTQIRVRAGASE